MTNYVSRFAKLTKTVVPVALGAALLLGLAAASFTPYGDKDNSYQKDCYLTTGCIDPQTGIMYKAGD